MTPVAPVTLNSDIFIRIYNATLNNTRIIEAFPLLIQYGKRKVVKYWTEKHPLRQLQAYEENTEKKNRSEWIIKYLIRSRISDNQLINIFLDSFVFNIFPYEEKTNLSLPKIKKYLNMHEKSEDDEPYKIYKMRNAPHPKAVREVFKYQDLLQFYSQSSLSNIEDFFSRNIKTLCINTGMVIQSVVDLKHPSSGYIFRKLIKCIKLKFDSYMKYTTIYNHIFCEEKTKVFRKNINVDILTIVLDKYYKDTYQLLFEQALKQKNYNLLLTIIKFQNPLQTNVSDFEIQRRKVDFSGSKLFISVNFTNGDNDDLSNLLNELDYSDCKLELTSDFKSVIRSDISLYCFLIKAPIQLVKSFLKNYQKLNDSMKEYLSVDTIIRTILMTKRDDVYFAFIKTPLYTPVIASYIISLVLNYYMKQYSVNVVIDILLKQDTILFKDIFNTSLIEAKDGILLAILKICDFYHEKTDRQTSSHSLSINTYNSPSYFINLHGQNEFVPCILEEIYKKKLKINIIENL